MQTNSCRLKSDSQLANGATSYLDLTGLASYPRVMACELFYHDSCMQRHNYTAALSALTTRDSRIKKPLSSSTKMKSRLSLRRSPLMKSRLILSPWCGKTSRDSHVGRSTSPIEGALLLGWTVPQSYNQTRLKFVMANTAPLQPVDINPVEGRSTNLQDYVGKVIECIRKLDDGSVCGKKFEHRAEDQLNYILMGLPNDPKGCPNCRQRMREKEGKVEGLVCATDSERQANVRRTTSASSHTQSLPLPLKTKE